MPGGQPAIHQPRRVVKRDADKDKRPHHLRRGQLLEGEITCDNERAIASRNEFTKIVAGDILHHAAAGPERRSAAGVAANPEQMIAGAPRLDARAAGEVAAESAADAAAVWRKPEKRPVVRRIEGEPLGVPGELRPDQR